MSFCCWTRLAVGSWHPTANGAMDELAVPTPRSESPEATPRGCSRWPGSPSTANDRFQARSLSKPASSQRPLRTRGEPRPKQGETVLGHAVRIAQGRRPRPLSRARIHPRKHMRVRSRVTHSWFSTIRLFTTENTPLTPFACISAILLSPPLLTTPSSVTSPFFTMM